MDRLQTRTTVLEINGEQYQVRETGASFKVSKIEKGEPLPPGGNRADIREVPYQEALLIFRLMKTLSF